MELVSKEAVLDTILKMICTQPRVGGKTLFSEFIKEWVANIESIPTIESRPRGRWERFDGYNPKVECELRRCSCCKRNTRKIRYYWKNQDYF